MFLGGLSVYSFVFNRDDNGQMLPKDEVYSCFLEFGFTLLGIALDFVWTAGFVLSLVYCNDMVCSLFLTINMLRKDIKLPKYKL